MDSAVSGLLMCGGEGSRLRQAVGDTEKPLVVVDGEPMVDHALDALQASAVDQIVAAVSPATPQTASHLADNSTVAVVETAGEGYVADLDSALERLTPPVVTVAADLPLVTAADIDRAVRTAGGDSLTVCLPASLLAELGVTAEPTWEYGGETVVPTGLNVVGDGADRTVVWETDRLAFNINRPADLAALRAWLDRSAGGA